MERRSARLPKQTPKSSVAEEELSPEDDVGYEEESEEMPLSKKQKGKKRKLSDDKADGQPQAKKVRGKRGILKQVVEMPFDVLFEIFGRLEPTDLLHLARTTKDIRTLLMKRSSISIWKASRSNIPGLPECPQDLSEPQYANLAFGKSCYLCNRNLSNIHILWSARLRICTKCLEDRFLEKRSYNWEAYRGYPAQLAKLVPTITMDKKSGRRIRTKSLYDTEVDSRWNEEYMDAEDKEKWLEDKIEERQVISEHANACIIWFENLQDLREQQKASMIDDRKAVVVEYLKKLGWEDELSRMSSNDPKPQHNPIVLKACRKEITERALSNLDEFLNSFMENQKRRRLIRERADLLKERLQKLNSILQTHVSTLPANALHPSVGELFRNPTVLDIVNNGYSSGHHPQDPLDSIIPMLPEFTLQWQKDIEGKLLALIEEGAPEYVFDPDTVLDLATTSFLCTHCLDRSLRYPRVLMHSCAVKDFDYKELEPDLHLLKVNLNEVYWNTRGYITFSTEDLKMMTQVVELCGFDPKTTTAAEMDIANPIFECVGCHDEHEGRATLTWSYAAQLAFRLGFLHGFDLGAKKMKLELLNEQDAVIARARISEMQARKRAGKSYQEMICVHCKLTGNTISLMKHVKKDHGKSPTDEDVVPRLDSNQVPPIFHLWPPREVVEEPSV